MVVQVGRTPGQECELLFTQGDSLLGLPPATACVGL